MNENSSISWIFLAIALGSQKEPVTFKDISRVADGINHAVPTEKEISSSVSWLSENGFITKAGNKYTLTKKGMIHYNFASLKTNLLLNIWKNLEKQIKV